MKSARTTLFAAGTVLLVGCGGAAPTAPARAPAAKPIAESAAATPPERAVAAAPQTRDQAEAALIKTIATEVTRFAVGSRPNEPHRPHVAPVPVLLSSLASANVPNPLANPTIPMTGSLPGDATDELVTDAMDRQNGYARQYGYQDVNLVLKSKAPLFGIHVGPWPDGATTASTSGYARCGKNVGYPVSPLRWETLTPQANGTLEYAVMDGWFDHESCKASVVRRTKVSAMAIVPGLLFGFRQCEGDCDLTSLTLLLAPTPSAVASAAGIEGQTETVSGFTRVTVPLRKGGGMSFMAELAQYQISPWRAAMGTNAPAYLANQLLVGLEVSQGVEDKDPIAVGYVADATPGALDGSLAVGALDGFDDVPIRSKQFRR